MTYLEKWMQDNPGGDHNAMIRKNCPDDVILGIKPPAYCDNGFTGNACEACWNRNIPATEAVKPQEAPSTAENTLKVTLDPGAKMPTRAHSTDAGLDLYSPIDTVVFPRRKNGPKNSVVIDTGVHAAIPVGYVGDVKSRSSMLMDDIITDGTVDAGYTGSIRVKLFNLGIKPVRIEAGQKIAQLVIKKIITPEIEIVDSLEETERGAGGFGSSGKF